MCTLGIDGVVDERLLVRRDGAVGVALGRLGVAEPDVGVGEEGAQLDRLAVRLDGLVEEPARLRQEQVAERLVRLRVGRVELRRGAELRGRLPAVAERLSGRRRGCSERPRSSDRPRSPATAGRPPPRCFPDRPALPRSGRGQTARRPSATRVGRAAFSIRATSVSVRLTFSVRAYVTGSVASRPKSSPSGTVTGSRFMTSSAPPALISRSRGRTTRSYPRDARSARTARRRRARCAPPGRPPPRSRPPAVRPRADARARSGRTPGAGRARGRGSGRRPLPSTARHARAGSWRRTARSARCGLDRSGVGPHARATQPRAAAPTQAMTHASTILRRARITDFLLPSANPDGRASPPVRAPPARRAAGRSPGPATPRPVPRATARSRPRCATAAATSRRRRGGSSSGPPPVSSASSRSSGLVHAEVA